VTVTDWADSAGADIYVGTTLVAQVTGGAGATVDVTYNSTL
jgi:hypothetical protein